MNIRIFFTAAVLAVSAATAQAANITYEVQRSIGNGTVTGSITTTGNTGQLLAGDVLSFDLELQSPDILGGSPVALTQYTNSGNSFVATATTLSFDFSLSGLTGSWTGFTSAASQQWWCLAVMSTCGGVALSENIGTQPLYTDAVPRSGLQVIASVAAVPVPAAAWLFGSALLGLGLARRRR